MTTKQPDYIMFPVKFPKQLEDWMEKQKEEGKPGSQKEFARQVIAQWEKHHPGQEDLCPISDSYVTDWKTGRQGIPRSYIPYIAEVLGVSPEVYVPTTHDEKYENSSVFITKVGKEHVEFANKHGLGLDFVEALTRIVDFNRLFPLYTPIIHVDKDTGDYDRKFEFGKSAPIDKDLKFLQIEREGKCITLNDCDLAFLKEVQDGVKQYVQYRLYEREQEMSEEVERLNQDLTDLIDVFVDGDPVTDPEEHDEYINQYEVKWSPQESLTIEEGGHKINFTSRGMTKEFYYRHDRFAKYFGVIFEEDFKDKENFERARREYMKENEPKSKTRKATQEDWDHFFEGKLFKGTHTRKNDQGVVCVVKEGK